MNKLKWISVVAAFFGLAFGFHTPVSAQATRTWVSGVGDDANPCSRTAPCKTFAGAISKTAIDGEINCIDPGGYGAVTITKSIVIDCGGTFGSVLNSLTNGIIVNAGASSRVILRNISLDGAGNGLDGIRVLSAATTHIENVAIRGNTGSGIDFQPTSNATLIVSGSNIRQNATNGIYVKPAAGMTAKLIVSGTELSGNAPSGLYVDDGGTAIVSDSTTTGNSGNGIVAVSAGTPTELVLSRVVSSGNTVAGVVVAGAAASIKMSNVSLTNNAYGIYPPMGGGAMVSFGNNQATGNSTLNGSPTSLVSQF